MKFESRKWCDLAPEALKIINNKLDHYHSTIELRLACKKWQNSVKPPFVRVHHFLPISFSFTERISAITAVRLVPTAVLLLRRKLPYCSWWLVSVEQSTRNDKLRVFHPLTRSVIPWTTLNQGVTEVGHPNLDFVKLSEGHSFRHVDGVTPVFSQFPENFCISKQILWRKPLWSNELLSKGDKQVPEYSVVRLHNQGNLHCFRISDRNNCCGVYYAENQCSSFFSKHTHNGFDDLVMWDGVVWAVNRQGKLFWINYQTLEVNVCVCCSGISTTSGCGSKRLLVTGKEDGSQELYMVVCNNNRGDFWVYKSNSEFEWEKVASLGENILFVGYDTCFFASTRRLNSIPGNCVIFPVNLYPCYSDNRPRNGVCHGVEDYLELRLTRYGNGSEYLYISECSTQVSNLFWPPPSTLFKPESNNSRSSSSSNDPHNSI